MQNQAGTGNHWLGIKLQGVSCNRDAIGARLVWSAGGKKRSRLKNGVGSYLSSHDPRQVLGLGSATKVDWLEIHWPAPSTVVQKLINIPSDRYLTVIEGHDVSSVDPRS